MCGQGFRHLLGALRVGVDRLDPLGRVGDIGGEHHGHRVDLVADGVVVLGSGGHRNLRDKGFVGKFVALFQIAAQCAGDQREDDVVELHVERLLDGLHPVQRHARARDPAMRRNRAVEADFRRVEVARRFVVDVADGDLLAHRLLDQPRDPVGRLDPHIDQSVDRLHLAARGFHTDQGAFHVNGRVPRLRGDVEQDLAEAGAGDAVDDGVVHLRDDGDPAVLQPLDEPQLPQRFRTVQLVRHQASDQLVELGSAAGGRHPDAPDVEVDVDLVVLDEVGPVESQRCALDPPPQLRKLGQSAHDQIANEVETECRRP